MNKTHPLSQTPQGFKISGVLQSHMCRIGSKLPFKEASEELYAFLELPQASDKQIERLCHHYGEKFESSPDKENLQLSIPFKAGDYRYVMGDGSMLLTREDGWKEIKVARMYASSSLIEEVSKNRNELQHSHYLTHFGDSKTFWEKLDISLKGLPTDRTVFIGDGAKWWWNTIEDHYGDCIQVLDYFHCASHVHEYATKYYGKADKQTLQWADKIMDLLKEDKSEEVLKALKTMLIKNESVGEKRDNLYQYLKNNQQRIRYGTFIKMGISIGSGPIESAHRNVIQQRLKLSGQRWTIKGAQQVANLRCLLKGKQWNKLLLKIQESTKIAA